MPPTPSSVAVKIGKGLYPRYVRQLHFPVQNTFVAYSVAHSQCGTRQQLPPKHYFLFRPITKTASRLRMTQSIKTADQLSMINRMKHATHQSGDVATAVTSLRKPIFLNLFIPT